jgi:hypothetical protein
MDYQGILVPQGLASTQYYCLNGYVIQLYCNGKIYITYILDKHINKCAYTYTGCLLS